jgi:hypothetical protein
MRQPLRAGYTAGMLVEEVEQRGLRIGGDPRIAAAVIVVGANDAAVPGQLQHVPIERFADALRRLVLCVAHRFRLPVAHVLLVTPPALRQEQWLHHCGGLTAPDRRDLVTAQYAARSLDVARCEGATAVDLHSAIAAALADTSGCDTSGYDTSVLHDGLHLGKRGNAILFDLLRSTLQQHLPHLDAPALPYGMLDLTPRTTTTVPALIHNHMHCRFRVLEGQADCCCYCCCCCC